MKLSELAVEYQKSATLLRERIAMLKKTKAGKKLLDQKRIEDRVVILSAEYYYLNKMSSYLLCYYKNKGG